jgi:hypothetical protein
LNDHWLEGELTWRNQRVAPALHRTHARRAGASVVTGSAGVLGSFVVERPQARSATDVTVPRIEDYNLRDLAAIQQIQIMLGRQAHLPLIEGIKRTYPWIEAQAAGAARLRWGNARRPG